MPTSYTSNLRLSNPGLGDTGWGSTVSNGMIDLVDPAIAGTTTLSADTDVILTTANGMADQARQMILNCTGSRAAQRTITAPASSKVYVVINGTTGGFGVKIVGVGPTTGVVVPAGRMAVVAWNGSDFVTLGAVVDLTASGNVTVAGNLGVGTTSPTGAKVVIEGPASAPSVFNALALRNSLDGSVALIFDNSASATLASIEALITSTGAGTDDGVLAFGTALNGVNAERMRLDASGLGIGTTSPTAKLHVAGQTRIQDSASASNYILIGSGTNAPRGGNSVMAQTGSMVMGTEAASSLFFVTNAATAMTLDASGNLGLGVTPSAWDPTIRAVQVANVGAYIAAGQNNYSISQHIFIGNNSYLNSSGQYIYSRSNPAALYRQFDASHLWFTAPSGTAGNAISFTQAMTLDASGNLGVGETSPDPIGITVRKLSSTASAGVNFRNDTGINNYVFTGGSAAATTRWRNNLVIYTGASQDILFETNATENARFTSSGALLLGTTDGNLSSGVGYKFAVGGSWGVVINQASTYNSFHYYNENSINNGYRFYVQADGGVANYSGNNVNLSDARVKTDIKPAPSYWNLIKAIEIVTFKYKDQDHSGDTIGVIAQQVERVAPELVDNRGFGETPEDGTPLKAVFSNDMYHAAIKALQEAMRRIEALEAKVAALEVK